MALVGRISLDIKTHTQGHTFGYDFVYSHNFLCLIKYGHGKEELDAGYYWGLKG